MKEKRKEKLNILGKVIFVIAYAAICVTWFWGSIYTTAHLAYVMITFMLGLIIIGRICSIDNKCKSDRIIINIVDRVFKTMFMTFCAYFARVIIETWAVGRDQVIALYNDLLIYIIDITFILNITMDMVRIIKEPSGTGKGKDTLIPIDIDNERLYGVYVNDELVCTHRMKKGGTAGDGVEFVLTCSDTGERWTLVTNTYGRTDPLCVPLGITDISGQAHYRTYSIIASNDPDNPDLGNSIYLLNRKSTEIDKDIDNIHITISLKLIGKQSLDFQEG